MIRSENRASGWRNILPRNGAKKQHGWKLSVRLTASVSNWTKLPRALTTMMPAALGVINDVFCSRHRGRGVKSVAFPCISGASRPHCTATRRSSLYIDLHDGYRRTTTSPARESWCVFYIIACAYTDKCPCALAMWCCSAVSFLYSCVLHVSQYIGFTEQSKRITKLLRALCSRSIHSTSCGVTMRWRCVTMQFIYFMHAVRKTLWIRSLKGSGLRCCSSCNRILGKLPRITRTILLTPN